MSNIPTIPLPPPVVIPPPEPFYVGDLIQVKIGHTLLFRPSSSTILPLAIITAIDADSMRAQLLLVGKQELIIPKSSWPSQVRLLAPGATVSQITAHQKFINYDVGDVVLVSNRIKARNILTRFERLGITYSLLELIGIIVGKTGQPNSYFVHFGLLENGVESLVMSDLHLLHSGPIPFLADTNVGSLPSSNSGLKILKDHWDLLSSLVVSKAPFNVKEQWHKEVRQEIQLDPIYGKVLDYLRDGVISEFWTNSQKNKVKKLKSIYKIEDGILYRISPESNRLVVPKTLIQTVLFLAHDTLQHFDWNRTYEFINEIFFIHGAPELVRRYVGSCKVCQKNRAYKHWKIQYGSEMAERMHYFNPGIHWAIDLKKIPEDKFASKYLLVAVDLCSRFVIAIPLINKEKEVVAAAIFKDILTVHGGSGKAEFLCDKGSEFINDYADLLFRTFRVTCFSVQERHSSGNGMVERFMQTFNNHFSKAMVDKVLNATEWSSWVVQLVSCYNGHYNPAISNTRSYGSPSFSGYSGYYCRGIFSSVD